MNKWIAVMSVVLVALGVAGAAAASTVKYDYDRDVDFSQWARAAWRLPVPGSGMTEKRIAKAVEAGFKGRGYTFVDAPEQADFVIDFRAAAWQNTRLEEAFHGPAFGRSLYVSREARGALVIEVYEHATGRLAWRGVVSDALAGDPDKADKKTARAVEKLLKKFPARGGGK